MTDEKLQTLKEEYDKLHQELVNLRIKEKTSWNQTIAPLADKVNDLYYEIKDEEEHRDVVNNITKWEETATKVLLEERKHVTVKQLWCVRINGIIWNSSNGKYSWGSEKMAKAAVRASAANSLRLQDTNYLIDKMIDDGIITIERMV